MFSLRTSRSVGKEKGEILDLLVFLLLTLILPLFTLGKLTLSETQTAYRTDGFDLWGLHILYHPYESTSLGIFLPALIVYLGLFVFFIVRRNRSASVPFAKGLFVFLFVFALLRLSGIFSFPYGNQDFTFIDPYTDQAVSLTYAGYPLQDRFIAAAEMLCFLSYFYLFFTYLPTFGKRMDILVKVFLYLLILVALISDIVTYFQNGDWVLNNIKVLFGDKDLSIKGPIVGIFLDKNIHGFFLLIGALACFRLFFDKPHLITFLLIPYFVLSCAISDSRTTFALAMGVFLALLVFFPISHFRKNKGWSIAFLSFLLIGVLLLIFGMIFRDSRVGKAFQSLFDHLHDKGTLEMREHLWNRALSMINTPYLWIFGYGKEPFTRLFVDYGEKIGGEPLWTTHSGYIEELSYSGLIGLSAVFAGFAYLLYQSLATLRKKNPQGFTGLTTMVILLLYSALYPQMLFLPEGNIVIFTFIALLPIGRSYWNAVNPLPEVVSSSNLHSSLTHGIHC